MQHSQHWSAQTFFELLKATVSLFLVLGICHFYTLDFSSSLGGSLFSIGFLVLAGTVGGRFADVVGLPRLTGYLIAGILSSPNVFHVISETQVKNMGLINNLALALIAFQAGCEFTNDMLKKNLKSLLCATASHVGVMAVGITLLVFFVCAHYPLLGDYHGMQLFALALILGTLSVAKSPAAVVALINETHSKGPLTDHALGIVVLLDVVVLALFSMVLTFATSLFNPFYAMGFEQLIHLSQELMVSIAAGCTFGLCTILYFKLTRYARILFIIASAYGVSAFCSYFHYDSMLVFVVGGYMVTNLSKQGEALAHEIDSISSIVMIVFFATAGASIHISQLRNSWELVCLIFFARAVLTWVAARVGHIWAKDTPLIRSYGFTPFISQAGLAIGLVIIVAERFPGAGGQIATIAISIVALNEIFGPPIFKLGLARAGEIGKKHAAEASAQPPEFAKTATDL